MSTQTSVLVVGAGPTGLMMAAQLARRGVSPIVIERNAAPSVRSKALGVQARTLELYRQLGIAERAVELGRKAVGAAMWVGGRRAASVPLGDIGVGMSRYPFLLILGQDANERILGETLDGLGVPIRWSTELVSLAEHPDHVTATVRGADGRDDTIIADYVAGCDGSHSSVRRLLDIDFVGAPYEHAFYVTDTVATGPMADDHINIFLWRGGFHLFFPMRGSNHWRIAGILPKGMRRRADVGFEEVAPHIRREVGGGLTLDECRWFATYRIHHRRARRFRQGRSFLLGDAAHIHSPVGAQGMNTGLQDAYNLAWKLALVTAHRASPTLLDSYAAEREPVADRLLATTDRAFSVVVSDRAIARAFRTLLLPRLLAFAMRRESARRFVFRTISQIGIGYRTSPLSVDADPPARHAPRAGDRFPWLHLAFADSAQAMDVHERLVDTRFHLLLVGEENAGSLDALAAASDFDGMLRRDRVVATEANVAALAAAGIPVPSYFLVRPDGHIGLAGRRFDESRLRAYMTDAIGWRPPVASTVR